MNPAALDATRNPPELGDPERVVRTVFGCRPEDVAERVVITPFIPLNRFRRHLQEPVAELSPPFFYKGFTAAFGGRRVTVLHTGVGPSRVGDCIGFLALTPARRLVFVGAVGGLAPEHRIGDWFVPTGAADGEGYARYVRDGFASVLGQAATMPAPDGSAQRLEAFLRDRGARVHRGRVFTIGSIAFESRGNLEALARSGFSAVEMELSSFFAAVARHGMEGAALTYVSDLPLRRPLWEPREEGETVALREAYRAAPRLALEWMRAG